MPFIEHTYTVPVHFSRTEPVTHQASTNPHFLYHAGTVSTYLYCSAVLYRYSAVLYRYYAVLYRYSAVLYRYSLRI
jgi:hypothetical protein